MDRASGTEYSEELQAAPTVQVEVDRQGIISKLRTNDEFFIQFFLAEELTCPIPDFHLDSFGLMNDPTVDRVADAEPRGHAKTTLARLSAVKHFLFSPWRFIVYLSNTAIVAQESTKAIMNFIRSDNFAAVFGPPEFEVDRDNSGYYVFWLRFIDEFGKRIEKKCILRSFGAGQQVRGTNVDNLRPQLAIVDDLEDLDNTATDGLVKKLSRWFYGSFLKALAPRFHKIIYIGNMLSAQSLLYRFVESPRWHSRRRGCLLSNGQPLWPEMWPLQRIREDFMEYQKNGLVALWFAEMMNVPIAEGMGLIESDKIPYAEVIVPGQQETAFLTFDPAISQKTWADQGALVCHALKDGVWRIAEVIAGHYTPDQWFFIIVEMCLKWRTRTVGIELEGFQRALQFLFKVLMVTHNQHFNVYEIPHKNKTKTERLSIWCSLLRKRVWALQWGDFVVTQQLLAYDPLKSNNRDDIIDSCSMGATMVEMYMLAIMEAYEPGDASARYQALTNIAAVPH